MCLGKRHVISIPEIEAVLKSLRARDNYRQLSTSGKLDFTSNDYLGLSDHPQIRAAMIKALEEGIPLGSGGSRLLRGNHYWHEHLEAQLAEFRGVEAALAFNSGFDANVGVVSTLCSTAGLVLSDSRNHASIIDGVRLSRASYEIFPHGDCGAVEEILKRYQGKAAPVIVTESVFSMDGDRAPLEDLVALAERYGAGLIVDEAHATGVLGTEGAGLVKDLETRGVPLISVHTCGKAFGGQGAFVACSQGVKDYLVNMCRTFIFTTALPPLAMAQWEAVLQVIHEEPWRRSHVLKMAERLREGLRGIADCGDSTTQIVPVILGGNARALDVASRLQDAGFDIRAIRYPTVPEGEARLRIAVNAGHNEATIHSLVEALKNAMAACGVA